MSKRKKKSKASTSGSAYVGHGHIVDSKLMTSRQLDVIIADDANTPVLFCGKNGTEFMPYESVYGFGELRSTYYKYSKPIEGFSEVIREISHGLVRQRITFSMGTNGVTNVIRKSDYGLNPLFPFMFFVSGEEFDFSDVRDFYANTPIDLLPAAVCILDKGVVLRACFVPQGNSHALKHIILNPSTSGPAQVGEVHQWAFLKARDEDPDRAMGFSLAVLCFMLFGSLSASAVLPPEMPVYLNHVLSAFPATLDV